MEENLLSNLHFLAGLFSAAIETLSGQNRAFMLVAILFVSLVLYIFRIFQSRFFLFSLLTLPATFMHELSHFTISMLTHGRPSRFSILPRRTDSGYMLGFVISRNITWYNGFVISTAPLLLIPLAYLFLVNNIAYEHNIPILFLKLYLLASMLEGSLPSTVDMKIAISKPLGLLVPIVPLLIDYSKFSI